MLAKEKHKFKKIQFNNFDINLNIKNLKKYKNIITKKINLVPITFTKGRITLFDEKNYVATIDKANLNLISDESFQQFELKGNFLGDNLYISFENIDQPTLCS